MTTQYLIPEYLDIDFNTFKENIKDLLAETATFKDYNFEGANITILIELIAYLAELGTYYANKIAKNTYIDTADIYETIHMLARLRGYNPKGSISSSSTLSILIPQTAGISPNDVIHIPAWKEIDSTETDDNGNVIKFSTVTYTTETIGASGDIPYLLTIPVKQGEVVTYSYTGTDLIDNMLYLPLETFGYDNDLNDIYPSIELRVNNEVWTRLSDIYDDISGLENEDNVYQFRYDKYERYCIEFFSSRNVPEDNDEIDIIVLRSLGKDSSVGANTIIEPETNFIRNRSTQSWIDNSKITITNIAASTGASAPETLQEIRDASNGMMNSQYRNVTANDYISHLESRSDVAAANVWGEQDIAPSGSVDEYNKVYISVIPSEWGSGTIVAQEKSYEDEIYYEPLVYSTDFRHELSVFLEPRKMLCAYEEYVLPELVYFVFDIGIEIKRTYSFSDVAADVRSKLFYYFDKSNRDFNEIISFLDVTNFIENTEIVDTINDNDFENIRGMKTLIIRNIDVINYNTIYEPNNEDNYPQYTVDASTYPDENQLRYIELGHNQFPAVLEDLCTFTEEA